jgi:hypothetical protein
MSTIRIKSGSTTPTTSNVVDSELAFDRATGKVYIGSGSAGGAATSVVEVGGEGKADSGLITSSGLTTSTTGRLLGRASALGGAIEELGVGGGLDLTAQGIQIDISGATEKAAAAVDADEILIADSAASGAIKKITRSNLISGLGGGTVTSVGLTSGESFINVTSSAVTASGNLSFEFNTQVANTFLAGPTTGADNNPTFRALVSDDLPDIDGGTY